MEDSATETGLAVLSTLSELPNNHAPLARMRNRRVALVHTM